MSHYPINLAVISLGSNKGNKAKNLSLALQILCGHEKVSLISVSSIYRTAPVEDIHQPFFYNAVAAFDTDLSAEVFFSVMNDTEREIGKEKERPKGPRRIDLDLLFFNSCVFESPGLTIPHPSLPQRLFVLKPLMEVLPFYKHPVLKKSIRELYFDLETDKEVKYKMPFPL